jgi:uncharacterized protein
MKIHRNEIPEEGLWLEGEWSKVILEPGEGVVRQIGPVAYGLQVGVDGSGFWAAGALGVDVELECVRCLGPFRHRLLQREFATHLEWGGKEQIDLTDVIREDILLILPSYPECHRDGGLVCPGPMFPSHLKPPSQAPDGEEAAKPNPWGPLDELRM